MLVHERWSVVTVLLTAFGRAVSEVGAVMIVGGNIDGVDRASSPPRSRSRRARATCRSRSRLGLILLVVVGVINAAVALSPGASAQVASGAR